MISLGQINNAKIFNASKMKLLINAIYLVCCFMVGFSTSGLLGRTLITCLLLFIVLGSGVRNYYCGIRPNSSKNLSLTFSMSLIGVVMGYIWAALK